MITLSDSAKKFIKEQESIEKFAERVDISTTRIYAFLNGESVSSNFVAKFLNVTGLDFEKAFVIEENK